MICFKSKGPVAVSSGQYLIHISSYIQEPGLSGGNENKQRGGVFPGGKGTEMMKRAGDFRHLTKKPSSLSF